MSDHLRTPVRFRTPTALNRRRPLQLETLEGRDVPAQVNFLAGTLTVDAGEGDTITISRSSAAFGGIVVEVASNIIFSTSSSGDIPQHVVVNLNKANTATLNISGSTEFLGNLTINAAKTNSNVNASTNTVYGNLNYITKTTGTDSIGWVGNVYGNANINMGSGSNFLVMRGIVHQSMTILAGSGNDSITAGGSSTSEPLRVLGNCKIKLGDGNNTLFGNPGGMHVQGNLNFLMGGGFDIVNFTSNQARLSVGGNGNFAFGPGGSAWDTFFLDVGGFCALLAGSGDDSVRMRDETVIGGKLSISTGNGSNSAILAENVDVFRVGGGFAYTGGINADGVNIKNGEIGGNVSINVGNTNSGNTETVTFGDFGGSGIMRVGGNVTLTGGNGQDDFNLIRAAIAGGLTCRTFGENDSVQLNDTSVGGPTAVYLGTGNDFFGAETSGSFSGSTRFSAPMLIDAGSDDDLIQFTTGGQLTIFGHRVVVNGGSGTDTLTNFGGNVFFRTDNTENCENGGF